MNLRRTMLAGFLLGLVALPLTIFPGCRKIEADRLYLLPLPGEPTEKDWQSAFPLRILAGGGHTHERKTFTTAQEIDRDTTHRVSASCHHGPGGQDTFPVWLSGFYDDENVYLRLRWPDLTRDDLGRRWVYRDGGWALDGGGGDALSLIWPGEGQGTSFNCSMACHLDDFTVSGGMLQERARMHFSENGQADLWLWRSPEGGTLDLYLDERGIFPDDGPEIIRQKNSRLEMTSPGGRSKYLAFGPGDTPYEDGEGNILPEDFEPRSDRPIPAYIALPKKGGRGNIRTHKRYHNGVWQITLKRKRDTGDRRDISFLPGRTYIFGLAVMDDTIRDHHVARSAWELKLIE